MPTTTILDDGRVFPVHGTDALSWDIGLYFTHAEEKLDYPKARAVIRAMREHRPAQLEQERREMVRGSFDKLFGHNSTQCLNLIESTR